jgi:chaperone modulatory protein CbpM
MTESQSYVFGAVIVEEQVEFTFDDLCRVCDADPAQMHALVDEGVLQPMGDAPARWRFNGQAMRTARATLRLARDLDLGPAAAALVLDLLQENARLRALLRSGEQA